MDYVKYVSILRLLFMPRNAKWAQLVYLKMFTCDE